MEDYEEINNMTMADGDDMEGMEYCIISWNEIVEQINWNRVMLGKECLHQKTPSVRRCFFDANHTLQ